jgi:hypothetical protein
LNNKYEDQIMATCNNIDDRGGETATGPHGALEEGQTESEIKNELPNVELTSISPGTEMPANSTNTPEPAIEPAAVEAAAVEPITAVPAIESVAEVAPASVQVSDATPAPATLPRVVLKARHKRYAFLAASVAVAAALGAVVGAAASGGFSAPVHIDAATVEENKAMQQSIARLGMEITTLKTSLEQANKSAHTQIAKITERLEHASAETTGSISPPQTTAPQTIAPLPSPRPASRPAPRIAAVEAQPPLRTPLAKITERLKHASAETTGSISPPQSTAPLPSPRPAPRIAAMEAKPPLRTPLVPGWAISDERGGYVYVENNGNVYQVVLGAPLPGLGPVKSVKRQDGRYMVVTPKGIIVSMRDRRYFEMY